jgi:hypothetical protein
MANELSEFVMRIPNPIFLGFGMAAPSLLTKHFSQHEIVPQLRTAATSTPTVAGNPNRVSLLISAINSNTVDVSLKLPSSADDVLLKTPVFGFSILTFADLGPLICSPFWITQESLDFGKCWEIIYDPKKC